MFLEFGRGKMKKIVSPINQEVNGTKYIIFQCLFPIESFSFVPSPTCYAFLWSACPRECFSNTETTTNNSQKRLGSCGDHGIFSTLPFLNNLDSAGARSLVLSLLFLVVVFTFSVAIWDCWRRLQEIGCWWTGTCHVVTGVTRYPQEYL